MRRALLDRTKVAYMVDTIVASGPLHLAFFACYYHFARGRAAPPRVRDGGARLSAGSIGRTQTLMDNQLQSLPDFANGKVVWFELSGMDSRLGGVLLEYIEFKTFGGRLFATGRMAQTKTIQGWIAGAPAAVSWDSVVHYIVFASREDYDQRAASFKPQKKGLFR